jgi:hypothetical protein
VITCSSVLLCPWCSQFITALQLLNVFRITQTLTVRGVLTLQFLLSFLMKAELSIRARKVFTWLVQQQNSTSRLRTHEIRSEWTKCMLIHLQKCKISTIRNQKIHYRAHKIPPVEPSPYLHALIYLKSTLVLSPFEEVGLQATL